MSVGKKLYYELRTFADIYLEDSYVLAINVSSNTVKLVIEAVLTEDHPQYNPPLPGEQYCYRNGEINFPDVSKVTWLRRSMKPISDPSGVVDYGNIDAFFYFDDERSYHLSGEWGELEIVSSQPIFEICQPTQGA